MKFTTLSFIFLVFLAIITIEGKPKASPKTYLIETGDEGGDNSIDYFNDYHWNDYNDYNEYMDNDNNGANNNAANNNGANNNGANNNGGHRRRNALIPGDIRAPPPPRLLRPTPTPSPKRGGK